MKKLADLLDAVVIERPNAEEVEQHLCLDRGYDYDKCSTEDKISGYIAHIPDASLPVPPPDDPNRHPPRRWVVSATGILGSIGFDAYSSALVKNSECYLGFVCLAASQIITRSLFSLFSASAL